MSQNRNSALHITMGPLQHLPMAARWLGLQRAPCLVNPFPGDEWHSRWRNLSPASSNTRIARCFLGWQAAAHSVHEQ